MGVNQWIIDAYNAPDPKPFLFQEGQRVRLRKGRSNDGQTPECWNGAVAVVLSRYSTGLMKRHWYKLRLDNGAISEFEEDEIDVRYKRKAR